MGTIIYDPSKKKNQEAPRVLQNESNQSEERYNALIESLDSVKAMGDTECDYQIYLEDYAYTYIYQYAQTDLSKEHSAVIVGEYYAAGREMIICGVIPIPKSQLSTEDEWINEEALESLKEEKEKYFPGTKMLGWLHMQPGYGTMLTMKEVRAHRDLFEKEGTILLLVDPINKIETFYAYEDDTLKEQTGYYIYYDKNPYMQQYMLDKPFIELEKEEVDDSVVSQFREIGRKRKKEYEQRKKTNFTVVAASIALLAVSAVVIKVNDQNNKIFDMQQQMSQNNQGAGEENKLNFVITPPEETAPVNSEGVTIVDKTQDNATTEQESTDAAQTEEQAVVEEIETPSTEEVTPEETATTSEESDAQTEVAQNTDTEKVSADEDCIEYIVQDGDTLRKISFDHYKTELRTKDIIALNGIDNGDQIYPGQTLKLPAE